MPHHAISATPSTTPPAPSRKERVFSGIQPTGSIHLGNYLGAIKQWVDSQHTYENIFCVVNSHAITTKQDPALLQQQTYELITLLLACGISPTQSSLFIQSHVDEHAALAWILQCFIPMGDMQRMTQFKDKSAKQPKNINVGLFNYPALMAADILLYQVDAVPVGEDQRQHLELTRDIATRFNHAFSECFTIPRAIIPPLGARVMGLDNPEIKMSKSVQGTYHAIFLLDSPDVIVRKCKKAVTDSLGIIAFDTQRAGVYNLLRIYQALSGDSEEAITRHFEGKGYGALKSELADRIIATLEPIQARYKQLINDKAYIHSMLQQSLDTIRPIAHSTYQKAKELVGLL